MAKLIKEELEKGRLHIDTPLMGESLVSRELLKQTEATDYFQMHPDINVIKIGGQSIMDRGGKALLPILEALIEAALRAGADGAKLSGGGRGGNMIALVTAETRGRVDMMLRLAGAADVIVTEIR
mgnify:CR=1 FL=1